MNRKDTHQSYGLGSWNIKLTPSSTDVFTERMLPDGQRAKIMDDKVFNKAVNAASKVKRK